MSTKAELTMNSRTLNVNDVDPFEEFLNRTNSNEKEEAIRLSFEQRLG